MRKIIENLITMALWALWLTAGLSFCLILNEGGEQAHFIQEKLTDIEWAPVIALSLLGIALLASHFSKPMRKRNGMAGLEVEWSPSENLLARNGKFLYLAFSGEGLDCKVHAHPPQEAPLVTVARITMQQPRSSMRRWLTAATTGLALLLPVSAHTMPAFSEKVMELSFSASFQQIREDHKNKEWGSEQKAQWRNGIIELPGSGKKLQALVRGRGNSSTLSTEGDFPKLRVEILKAENRKGTPFEQSRKFRINTHVSSHPKTLLTPLGRLNNENSPWREALAYDLAKVAGFSVPEIRRAIIHYLDTGTEERLTRKALLIETDKDLADRLGAVVIQEEDFASKPETGISALESAKLHLFQSLLGNDDFILRVSQEAPNLKRPDWDYSNVIVMERSGKRFLSPYDFDLSSFVAGEIRLEAGLYAQPIFGFLDDATGNLAMMTASLRARHGREAVERALEDLLNKIPQMEAVIQGAKIDEEGRAIALRHLSRFVSFSRRALDLPVAQAPGIVLYKDALALTTKLNPMPKDSRPGELRVGTPIKVLGRENGFLKIAILDYRLDLPPVENEIGYVQENIPIGNAPLEQFIGWIDERDGE